MHEFEDTTSEQRDMAIFQELCNREEIDLNQKPYQSDNVTVEKPPPEPPKNLFDDEKNDLNSFILSGNGKLAKPPPEPEVISNVNLNESLPPGFLGSQFKTSSEVPPMEFTVPKPKLRRESSMVSHHSERSFGERPSTKNLDVDKASLLHEIKQLQMLNPTTAVTGRDFSLDDSYETLQLGLFQVKQSVEIASGVNTMKDFLKMGCTGLELGCNKFGRGYVNLNGWSGEVCGDINGPASSYNAPLQQIYRKYWRNGGTGMNPFLQLVFLLLGSATVYGLKKKFLGTASTSVPMKTNPPGPSMGPVQDTNTQAMPHNRPKSMKRPSIPANMQKQTQNNLSFNQFENFGSNIPKPTADVQIPNNAPTIPGMGTTPNVPSMGTMGGMGGMQIDPQMLATAMKAVAPMMANLGPMMSAIQT